MLLWVCGVANRQLSVRNSTKHSFCNAAMWEGVGVGVSSAGPRRQGRGGACEHDPP